MKVEVRFHRAFQKAYAHIKSSKDRTKAGDALENFQNEGSSAPHFKYLKEIPKKLKGKGLVLARLQPLIGAKAHGAWRILLREDEKDSRYTALDIQPHENCYRDWKRKYENFL